MIVKYSEKKLQRTGSHSLIGELKENGFLFEADPLKAGDYHVKVVFEKPPSGNLIQVPYYVFSMILEDIRWLEDRDFVVVVVYQS